MAKMKRQTGKPTEVHLIFKDKEVETLSFLLQQVDAPNDAAQKVVSKYHWFLNYALESQPGAEMQEDLP